MPDRDPYDPPMWLEVTTMASAILAAIAIGSVVLWTLWQLIGMVL